MDKLKFLSKFRNSDKIKSHELTDGTTFLCVYKMESMGAQSRFKHVNTLYIEATSPRGHVKYKRFTGRNITEFERKIREGKYVKPAKPKPTAKPKKAATPKPPAGSGLQMQSSFGGGGGQTYFTGASPKKKGKTAAKKTAKKKAKKGSGSLAPFGVMPEGQKTLEEMAEAMLG